MKKNTERESRETRILATAKRHFETYGYKKTTIDGLVQAVGIAKGTFFLHFKSKEALLLAVYARIREEAMHDYLNVMQTATGPAQKVESLLRFALEQLAKQPLFQKLENDPEADLFRRILDFPDSQAELDQALAMLRQLLQAGIDAGELRPDLDLEVLPFILGSLKFLMLHPVMISGDGRLPISRYIDGLVHLTMQGLLKGGSHDD